MSDATWITLGTAGGPPMHASQSQIANAVVVDGNVYLFDVGNGVLRQLAAAGLGVRDIRAVFLSHHHMDHNADVGPVIISTWLFGSGEPALPVIGPPGTKALVDGIVAANAATVLASFPVDRPAKRALADSVAATDLPREPDGSVLAYEDEHISVRAMTVDHYQVPPAQPLPEMPVAVGYRVVAGDRLFAYSGDTGPSENLVRLAEGADILVTEVVDLEAIERSLRAMIPDPAPGQIEALVHNMGCNHLTPQAIGDTAARAAVGHVVLTHYVPAFDDQPDIDAFVRGIAPTYDGQVTPARDLDHF